MEPESAGATTSQADPARPLSARLLETTFASLAERDFAWYFAGNFAFFMAIQMNFILFGYLAFELTDSAKALGVVAAANTAPMLLMAPVSGTISDRVNKLTLLRLSQAVALIGSLVLGALIITEHIAFWHLVLASACVGFVMSVNQPTRQAVVPQLVPRHKIMNAISLQMGEMNLTRILSPALAGLLVAPLGVGWVLVIASALFLAGIVTETKLPRHGMTGHSSDASFFEQTKEGFSYILHHETIRLLILANFLIPMLAFPVQQSLPVFAKEVFGYGAAGLGFMAGAMGIGGLCGAILAANLNRETRKGLILLIAGAATALLYVAFALCPLYEVAILLLALAAASQMVFMTTNNSSIQSAARPEVRGRVLSVMGMSIGLTPLALFPVAAGIDAFGAPAAVAASSLIMLSVLLAIFWSAPKLRGLRMDSLAHAELSPAQAARLVASGELTREQADALSGVTR